MKVKSLATKTKDFLKAFIQFIRSKSFKILLFCTLASITITVFFISAITPYKYQLSVGMVPTHTITASRDVIDEFATERNRKSAAAAVAPTYVYNDGVTDEVLENLSLVQAEISAVIQYAKTLSDYSVEKVYSDEEVAYASSMMHTVTLKSHQIRTLLASSEEDVLTMLSNLYDALGNTMQSNVSEGQESAAVNSVLQIIGYRTDLNLLQNVAAPILRGVIRPNMIINLEATEKAKEAAMAEVEPVLYKQGQNIVVKGEGIISQSQIKVLENLGLLASSQEDLTSYYGAVIVVIICLLALNISLYFFCRNSLHGIRQLFVVYIAVVLSLLLSLIAKVSQLVYIAPITLSAMLISATLGAIPAAITNISVSVMIPFMLTVGGGNTSLDIIYLISSSILSGTIASLMLRKNTQRGNILLTGLVVSIVNFLTILGIGYMLSGNSSSAITNGFWAVAGVLLSTMLTLAFQLILETSFNLSTTTRLLDLSNPMHPLLKRLQLEAPGTYHHSIIIANLAEAAAQSIGANELLARVGGYYHDIGKLKRPLYFKENQIGKNNIHDTTEPSVSASIIASHTRDGIVLAKQYRLPLEIQNIILNHHGNSLIKYFYNKALEQANLGETVDEKAFRYDGEPPNTKETSIVMICDTIEAAVRTLTSPSKEEIIAFIKKLIDGKINEGQMVSSPLSFSDLENIAQSSANVLYGVFHERIEYPEQKNQGRRRILKTTGGFSINDFLSGDINRSQNTEGQSTDEKQS